MGPRTCGWAPIPLRLALGFGMAYHGFPKVIDPAQREQLTWMLTGVGFPEPELWAWCVGFLEFGGGLLLILGAFTRALSALFIVEMVVAIYLVHLPHGFSSMNMIGMGESGPIFGMPGYELNVLYVAGFAALLIMGAGILSVDRLFRRGTPPEIHTARTPRARHPADSLPRGVAPWRRRVRRSDEARRGI